MIESAITSKGQTTLPKSVREALAVQPGDRLCYIIHGDEVRIKKVQHIGRLFGMLEHDGATVNLQDMERAIIEGASGK